MRFTQNSFVSALVIVIMEIRFNVEINVIFFKRKAFTDTWWKKKREKSKKFRFKSCCLIPHICESLVSYFQDILGFSLKINEEKLFGTL
jgi:hypothetical protein